MKMFSNGPLPERFKIEAVISPDGSEFALPPDTSKLFINWCYDQCLKVTGYDIWLENPTDNTLLDDHSVKGDAEHCLREIECTLNHPDILVHNRRILFNIWVDVPVN